MLRGSIPDLKLSAAAAGRATMLSPKTSLYMDSLVGSGPASPTIKQQAQMAAQLGATMTASSVATPQQVILSPQVNNAGSGRMQPGYATQAQGPIGYPALPNNDMPQGDGVSSI